MNKVNTVSDIFTVFGSHLMDVSITILIAIVSIFWQAHYIFFPPFKFNI